MEKTNALKLLTRLILWLILVLSPTRAGDLNALINCIQNTSQTNCILDNGVHTVQNTIVVTRSVTISGQSTAAILKRRDQGATGPLKDMIRINETFVGAVTFSNITVDGNRSGNGIPQHPMTASTIRHPDSGDFVPIDAYAQSFHDVVSTLYVANEDTSLPIGSSLNEQGNYHGKYVAPILDPSR